MYGPSVHAKDWQEVGGVQAVPCYAMSLELKRTVTKYESNSRNQRAWHQTQLPISPSNEEQLTTGMDSKKLRRIATRQEVITLKSVRPD